MARSNKHPILLFILLASFNTIIYAIKVCPNCGTTPIPYPLSTSPDCGDERYTIRCTKDVLYFDTLNNTYPITSISPKTERLTIQPSPFLPNTCMTADIYSQGIQLNSSLPFNITSSNTVLYLNCTDAILQSPLNCSSSSLCHSYINQDLNGSVCVDAPVCCHLRTGGSATSYMIRIGESRCRAYRTFVNLDEALPVNKWPTPALELEWATPSDQLLSSKFH